LVEYKVETPLRYHLEARRVGRAVAGGSFVEMISVKLQKMTIENRVHAVLDHVLLFVCFLMARIAR